jgi:hypothetical protein
MMMRLKIEASLSGGKVLGMLGNHEVMNMQWLGLGLTLGILGLLQRV